MRGLDITICTSASTNEEAIELLKYFNMPFPAETKIRNNMAKQSSIQKNMNREKIVNKFKSRRNSLKKMIMKKDLSMEERFKIQSKLNDLPRDSSNIRVRNRCKITGRTRGVYRKFGLSRIKIRELTMSGSLPGVVKSSW